MDGVNDRKRGLNEPEEEDSRVGKRQRQEERRRTSLVHLPVELLYSIHLYAKNPAFAVITPHFRHIFSSSPTSVKAGYLIGRWHEAYCYGFLPIRKTSNGKVKKKQSTLPSTPTSDLLENGAMAELKWSSRLLPVLPVKDFPYPLSNSFQRSADHFILDFCLRYPLCDDQVLCAVEDIVLSSSEFGNITLATGLWKDTEGNLCSNPTFIQEGDGRDVYQKPSHLMVNELPKRIFQQLTGPSLRLSTEGNDDQGERMQSDPLTRLDSQLSHHLLTFGPGPLPTPPHLLSFLAIISLHVPTAPTFLSATNPVNCYEGMPLARSVFAKSQFMVQILLCLGAEPSRKANLALYVAIRSGWLDGLKTMVERDESRIAEWESAIQGVRRWFKAREESRRGVRASEVEARHEGANVVVESVGIAVGDEEAGGFTTRKRRRLLDRAHMDSKMLKEAVKHSRWPVANWLRSKGVVPDLRTIKLIEMKQGASESS